jgi:hypothetical protein
MYQEESGNPGQLTDATLLMRSCHSVIVMHKSVLGFEVCQRTRGKYNPLENKVSGLGPILQNSVSAENFYMCRITFHPQILDEFPSKNNWHEFICVLRTVIADFM